MHFRNPKKLNSIIKIALMAMCLGYLFYKLSLADFQNLFAQLIDLRANKKNWISIIAVVVLMILNWSTEAVKWKLLIEKLENIRFMDSLKSILSGISISIFTPNRAGEFVGKIFYLKEANKSDATVLSMVGSIAQVLITFIFGLYSSFFWACSTTEFGFYKIYLLIGIGLINALCIWAFFQFQFIAKKWKKGNFIRAMVPYNLDKIELSKIFLLGIFLLSLLRYMLFAAQYFLLLKLFGIEQNSQLTLIKIALYFFYITLIPTYALTELGVRGSVAVYLFCADDINCSSVLAASLMLWLINIAIPAAFGSVFLGRLNFIRDKND